MGDKYVHYHVSIDSDLKAIQEVDAEKIKEMAKDFAQLAEHMATVSIASTTRRTKEIGMWSQAFVTAAVSCLMSTAAIWAITWLIIQIKGMLGL